MTEDTLNNESTEVDELKESLKKRLELELGLPLTPKLEKKIERNFHDDIIMVENFPLQDICTLKIGADVLTKDDYILNESEGIIYLNQNYAGLLYLEYTYCLPESEYMPLLDLMVEYENDTGWNKDATTITEKNVSISYDASMGKGARIQSMIVDIRNRYSCYVEMI